MSQTPAPTSRLSWLLMGLCLLGTALSVLTIVEHITLALGQEGFSFCKMGQVVNCASVLQSEYSVIFGLPLGSYGVAFYLFFMFLALFARPGALKEGRVPMEVLLFLSSAALLSSLGLFFISLFLIKGLCPLCLGTYAVNILLFVLTAWGSRKHFFRSILIGGEELGRGAWSALLLRKSPMGTRTLSVCALLGCVILCLASASLPFFIAAQVMTSAPVPGRNSKTTEQWYQAWKVAAVESLPSSVSGGALGDFEMGPATAAVHIFEFSDFECPFCQTVSQVLEEIVQRHPQDVRFTFKNFPLDRSCNRLLQHEMHRFACLAAEAARCAGEQGMFHEYLPFLFTQAFQEPLGEVEEFRSSLLRKAEALRMDTKGFSDCLTSRRHLPALERDIQQGAALGISGTPTIWINGRRVQADSLRQMLELLPLIVESELKASQSGPMRTGAKSGDAPQEDSHASAVH